MDGVEKPPSLLSDAATTTHEVGANPSTPERKLGRRRLTLWIAAVVPRAVTSPPPFHLPHMPSSSSSGMRRSSSVLLQPPSLPSASGSRCGVATIAESRCFPLSRATAAPAAVPFRCRPPSTARHQVGAVQSRVRSCC
ncbi:unnamed protein product [Lactuca virosa]|uniref:Uncharacterized protein n=1 Tax=Lactuca virosa TaxID=75947 RepID=A0AAU9PDH3_9ASTR|nr:unnamed protein product [Lactuca virosa]